jgi:hypothetical protein
MSYQVGTKTQYDIRRPLMEGIKSTNIKPADVNRNISIPAQEKDSL